MSPRTGKRGTKRDAEVLEAAAKVFYNGGYADASVQDIASEMGILKGSLYHYMESKEDLLFWLLTETHEHVEAIRVEVVAQDLQPLEALREYIRRQVEYTSRNLRRMAIYYHDVDQLSKPRARELNAKRRTHGEYVSGLIEQAQKNGEASKSLDATMATDFLFGSMIWVYRWYRPKRDPKPSELAESCADFVLNGVVGQSPSRR